MRLSRGALLAATAVLLLTGTACTSETPTDPADSGDAGETRQLVRLYGSDGNMSNSFGAEFKERPGLLAGMKGTTPLTPLEQSFKGRLAAVDPKLDDFSYAAETYDAIVISAIAAEMSRSTRSADIARFINGVTTVGTVCDSASACLVLARAGEDLQYRGISLRRGGFTDAGEPAAASYATLHFGTSDRLDDGKTEFVGAGDESATTRQESPKPPPARKRRDKDAEPLRIGGLLPHTGSLALMLPPMAAAARLAVDEINAAGGVQGRPVEWINGDDGTNPEVAKRTVATHIEAGVQVIIGAGASGVTRAVLPDVVKAGVVLFSPCNTAADLTTAQDKGLYFRTAPSDILQGKALADVIMRDGSQKVAIVARDDAYGAGLQKIVKAELEQAGLPGAQIRTITYPSAEDAKPDFGAAASDVKSFQPDGVLVIGFGESAAVIKALDAAGLQLNE
jgi:ABC-type branched-subunit amino acid transport system substrate-binding protein